MSRLAPPSTRTTSGPGVAGVLKRLSSFEHPAPAPRAINSNAPQRHPAAVAEFMHHTTCTKATEPRLGTEAISQKPGSSRHGRPGRLLPAGSRLARRAPLLVAHAQMKRMASRRATV